MENLDETQVEENANVEGQELAGQETTSDSSPDSGENHEQESNGVQKRIDKLTAKKYEAERKAADLEAKLAKFEAEKPIPQGETLEAPSLPEDMYDEESMRKYHKDMISYTQKAAQSASKSTFEERQKTDQEAKAQAAQQEVISKYAQNAIKDGVDLEKLKVAEQTLNNSGVSPELGQYLMNDVNGGKIVEYLHDNPAVMHEVLSLDPVSAGIKIANEVKANALSTTPKVTNTPEPIPDIKGGGALNKDDFERNNPGTEFI